MNHPRFLFLPRAGAATTVAAAPVVSVGWRLLGANNRGLGQGWDSHPGLAACRAAVESLREDVVRARPVLAVSETSGLWVWRLELDGRRVAVSSRSYQRQRECQYSLTNFLRAVPEARVAAGLVALGGRRFSNPRDDRPPPWPPAAPGRTATLANPAPRTPVLPPVADSAGARTR
ncbi:hypothetical protein ACIQNU_14065 [Streptomyces sp. NPDC091292]|uniref:hypothetical protein n=1 Tax=Streptomyces sp. NPDC091292 TaxID=3365991 RepID=UPI00382405A3